MDTEIIASIEVIMKKTFKEKVDWFSCEYDSEIGGFITGEIKEGKIILEDLLIPEQTSSYADVNFSTKDLVKLRKEYGDKCIKIIGEWHSHHSMGLGWSNTDLDFIKEFAEPREITCFVLSSLGRHLIRVEIRKPFNISLGSVPYKVEIDTKLKEELQEIINKKIKKTEFDWKDAKEIKYEKVSEDEEEEKEMDTDEKISRMLQIHKGLKIIEVFDLDYTTSELMREELKQINPIIHYEERTETGYLSYRAEFQFQSKKQMKKGIRKIKEFLKEFYTPFRDFNSVYDDYDNDNQTQNYRGYYG